MLNLPGHAAISHCFVSTEFPMQPRPLPAGEGLVLLRSLRDRPGPHVRLQPDQPDHAVHAPLTENNVNTDVIYLVIFN